MNYFYPRPATGAPGASTAALFDPSLLRRQAPSSTTRFFLVLLFLAGLPLALLAQQAPTALRYPTPNVYVAGVSNVFLSPTVSGNVTGYSISPGLPSGLTFNTSTGVISGTPTTTSPATTYTVTASNAAGSTSTTLSIQVTTSFYNNNNNQLSFDNATQITGTNGGRSVGDRMLYTNVVNIGGTRIDAIITTTALTNVSSFDAYDQPAASGTNFNSNDPKFFSPQFQFSAAGLARFDIQFILGTSYNASTNPNGTPVILQNVLVNSYDIDGNGGANSNQYNLFGGFNTYALGNPTNIAVTYDPTTTLTRFRSTTINNSTTVTADPHRIRLTYNNVSNFPLILGTDGSGVALYFVDFSAGPTFSTAVVNTAPSIELNPSTTGVNNEATGCASAFNFTSGGTNVATPSNNTFDSLVVRIPVSEVLNGASEQLVITGSTGGPITLANSSGTITLGGISYAYLVTVRNGIRNVRFTRAGTTAAQLESLLDALQYQNTATSISNGTRNFTVNAYTPGFESPDAVFSVTLNCVGISGNIFRDANGLTDNTVNAIGTQFAANAAYAVLVNASNNQVVRSVGIAAGGAYDLGTVDAGSYIIYVRNSAATAGSVVTTPTYPTSTSGSFVPVGENVGAGAGNDGLVDGKIILTVGSTSVTNANFGLELPPTTQSGTISGVANPGGFNAYTIPTSGGFTYADEDGTVSSITITSFPTGANYIRLNGILYTNGGTCPPQSTCTAFPGGGVVVPAANISSIAVDPTGTAATSVVIPFRATDNANVQDVNASPSTLTVNFVGQAVPISVSGNAWDDVNGNGIKEAGEAYVNPANPGETLYAILVQTTNSYSGAATVYTSTPVTAGATGYTFNSVPSGNNYEVRLASLAAQPTAGVALSSITTTLPTGWVDVSYNNNGAITTGLNTTTPVITLGTVTSTRSNVNFGLDARPTAVTAPTVSVTNPGGTGTVAVPVTAFSGTDAVDPSGGIISYVRITAFPSNNVNSITITGSTTPGGPVTTTTYTAGDFPASGVYVATTSNGNLADANAVRIDPVSGATTVAISYRVVDNANIESTNTATANITVNDLTISGTVFDDADGVTDGLIDGTPISNAGGVLFVNLVNTATNTVIASTALNNGAFDFGTINGLQSSVTTYRLVLSASSTSTVPSLPSAAWVNTAEGLAGTAGDGTGNGLYDFGGAITNNTVVNFGIDALPSTTILSTATPQVNPGGTRNVTVPASTFSGTDATDLAGGQISYVRITAFPANATSITLTGATTPGGPVTTTTYTAGTFPAGGVYVATNANGNPLTPVLVDPVNGAVNVDVTYKVVDNALKESANTGTARQPLTELSLSGTVYDDVNGGIINGTPISSVGVPVYVNLVNGTTFVASSPVVNGTYNFTTADGLESGITTYKLVLTTDPGGVTSPLPPTFANTAEGLTGTTGDGTPNGTFIFGGAVNTSQTIDFGINALPTVSALNTAPAQVNPGGTTSVVVPAATFSGADDGDISGGQVSYIRITSFPTNATSITLTGATTIGGPVTTTTYTSGTFPGGGVYVATNANGNPLTDVLIDPLNGAVTVEISYRTVDNAGMSSTATGIARQPFTDLTISGTVYDDVNGGIINGTPISNADGPLFVNLVNTATNTVLASQALTNGTYSFGTANGLSNDVSTYAVVLSKTAGGTTGTLPSDDWVFLAEGLSGTTGDPNANGRYTFGAPVTGSVVVDFAIDARPTPATLTVAAPQVNPGGTATVTIPAATFSGTDAEDLSGGEIDYIRITSFPTNATTVSFAAASTTLGGATGPLSYTALTFPAGGVYVATNPAGNPLSAISADPIDGAVNVDFAYAVVDNAGVESNATGIARQPLTDLTISGTVYNDVTADVIDGTPISDADGQLYVNLVNTANNTVVASRALTNGTYSFTTADGVVSGGAYRLVLTSSATATGATLPDAGWVYIAEGISGTTGDGSANGTYTFGAPVTTAQTIDFAIEALPVPAALTVAPAQVNPGGTNLVTIPAATFVATDNKDLAGGAVSYIHIISFPTNTTTVNFASAATSVNGTYGPLSYTAGTFPAGGVYVATNANGNPLSAITVDPVDGTVNVDFTYTAIDNTGRESGTSGIARQPLTALSISGTVFDDTDGNTDNTIDGTPASAAGGSPLFVNLVSGGVVVQSVPLTNGTFTFSNLVSGGNYTVVLSTLATGTTGLLPPGWVNTAEGTTAAGDGAANGLVTVNGISTSQTVNFGFNGLPTAISVTTTAQNNPGGNVFITAPPSTFAGTDPDVNGEIALIHLTAFPGGVTTLQAYSSETVDGTPVINTYTVGTFPAGGIYIPTSGNGNSLPVDAVKIDPAAGATQATFIYTVIDIAGYESAATATSTVPFVTGAISGVVYNDVTALLDGAINGTGFDLGNTLFVNAVNGSNVVVASANVAADGTYVIEGLGNGTYTLVLTTSAVSNGATLPAGWVNTGEGLTPAGDGTPNGSITVNLTSAGVDDADFGVNARPTAAANTAPAQVNPGGTNNVTIPADAFSGTDAVDVSGGEIDYIRITAFPANATTITITGVTTLGDPVTTNTYTALNFPGTGVFVATDPNGNLANPNAVQVDPLDGAVTITIPYRVVDNGGLESTNTVNATQPLSDLLITGTVYNDVDAGTINGTPISNVGTPLFVNLVSGGNVVASQQLTNGTFSFSTANGVESNVNNYTLVLATSATATTGLLPATWVNTAEGTTGSNGDGSPNGVYSFGGAVTSNVTIDFGIDALPTAVTATAPSQVNPGGTNTALVPAATFSGTDAVDLAGGEIDYVRIVSFPTNATSITITGSTTLGGPVTTTTYTSGTFPGTGVFIATDANGNLTDADAVRVDPVNGAVTVAISYRVIDNAGEESTNTAIANQPFSDVLITGTVYDDADGTKDGLIDGTPISNAYGQLYVNLVNTTTGTVVASQQLTNGTFSFSTADGIETDVATYHLVLTESATATTPGLPNATAWVNTSEGISGTAGDAIPNGRFVFGSALTTNLTIDFGIDARPTVTIVSTAASQQNPGGTGLVTIPASVFNAADTADISGGEVDYLHITTFPTNTTTVNFASAATSVNGTYGPLSYTAGTFPAGGVYVATNANGNPLSAITVDPVDGAVTVDFIFRAIDNAGVESTLTGTARQPLTDILISGNVYDDVNGGTINGALISDANGQLYVNLVSGGLVVASQELTNGSFSFSTADGVRGNVADYTLVLTDSPTATTATLPAPADWVYLAEGTPGSTGDGTANGTFSFGGILAGEQEVDFAINARPVVTNLITAAPQVNPGGTNLVTIPAATFGGNDDTDIAGGEVDYLRITTFPTNTTTVNFASAATSVNGTYGPLSYTAGTFPAGGVYVATNANGNPLSAITVDPVDGAVNVDFTYLLIDNAGVESKTTGTARQPLTDLLITGTVYDDEDGSTDGVIDGSPISDANGQLYVNLINTANNTVVASQLLTNGTFSFSTANGVEADVTTYALVLTNDPASTAATLPDAPDWVNTGEGPTGTTGDVNANGRYQFGGAITGNVTIDFGIDARPEAATLTVAPAQLNPGGTNTVTIPSATFSGTDTEDISGGEIDYIHITSFPTNATTVNFASAATTPGGTAGALSYTAATFPVGGVYVATNPAGNPLPAITVDPVDGAVNVDFTYLVIDNAGVESLTPGIARQPLSGLTITGTVRDDFNGLSDALINGAGTNAGGALFVNAIDGASNVIASAAVAADGTFSLEGLTPGTYTLVVTTAANSASAVLPSGYAFTGEGIGTASDGTVNGRVSVTLAATDVTGINFGLDRLPVADAKTYLMTPDTNPNVDKGLSIPSTASMGVTYSARVNLSGAASSGSTPGALTGLDPDGDNGAPLTLTAGTPNVFLVIDPASYTGTRNGSPFADPGIVTYAGVQLQPGGCQGGDIGDGVCAYYNTSSGYWEIPAYDLSALKILLRTGASSFSFEYAWRDEAGIIGDFTTYTLNFDQALPVRLITFSGEKRNNTAALSWTTVNEQSFRGYAVERSTDGSSFSEIGFVNGRGSATEQRYGFNDDLSTLRVPRVYYRLRLVDINGSYSYSPIVRIDLNGGKQPSVIVLSNPVRTSGIRLQIDAPQAAQARILVVDNLGRVVSSRQQALSPGSTSLTIDLPSYLANGIYTVVTEMNGTLFRNKVQLDR
ncbi:hypothetical protein [Flaviaesturariibacter amylovorans]|uniref:T9SS type B sorting domain-containing protein n=1 Tax=Flaviaesturariibacter amylovorans TaxID=1084520 RepID=A0ABP8GFB1_9BACT